MLLKTRMFYKTSPGFVVFCLVFLSLLGLSVFAHGQQGFQYEYEKLRAGNGSEGLTDKEWSNIQGQIVLGMSPSYQQQAYLKASNTESTDLFGWSTAISGDTLVVGAHGEDSTATGVNGDEIDNFAEASKPQVPSIFLFAQLQAGNNKHISKLQILTRMINLVARWLFLVILL